jgi:hypothetical protein
MMLARNSIMMEKMLMQSRTSVTSKAIIFFRPMPNENYRLRFKDRFMQAAESFANWIFLRQILSVLPELGKMVEFTEDDLYRLRPLALNLAPEPMGPIPMVASNPLKIFDPELCD